MGLTGKVYLVGAGPGDAGLLTLRGAELLQRADVVVYDSLVNRELLALAPEAAEIIFGGKRPRDRAIPQEELNQLLAEKAKAGKTVVRLKGGDPYIFGRGGEEAARLHRDGVPFEVVPGISSIIAAPSYAGIPLTHREHCSSFTVITGHEDPDKDESALDWERVAREPGTKVLLMGVERIGKIAAALEANGLPADTPAAMVRWGTMGRQQTITATLGTLAAKVAKADFKAPAVTVIGTVSTLRDTLNWYENRPLFVSGLSFDSSVRAVRSYDSAVSLASASVVGASSASDTEASSSSATGSSRGGAGSSLTTGAVRFLDFTRSRSPTNSTSACCPESPSRTLGSRTIRV